MSCDQCKETLAVWVGCSSADVPPNPIVGGYDRDDAPLYVGRAEHDGDLIPGKVVEGHGVCYIPHNTEEHIKSKYEVLCNPSECELKWIPSKDGCIPIGALDGGYTNSGDPLYIGRVNHNGFLTIGKVHCSHGLLYVPFGGSEHSYSEYEVLACSRHHVE